MAATIHITNTFLSARLASLATNALKCVLIDISTYNKATDTVLADLTQVAGTGGYSTGGYAITSAVVTPANAVDVFTTVVFTIPTLSGSTTISATGAAIIDTTDGNKIIAVDDFGATVASSGGTYSVAPITLKFTHF